MTIMIKGDYGEFVRRKKERKNNKSSVTAPESNE